MAYEQPNITQNKGLKIFVIALCTLVAVCGGILWIPQPEQTNASSDTDSTALNSAETQYYLEINSRNSRPDRIEQPAVADNTEPDQPVTVTKRQVSAPKQRVASKTARPASADGQGDAQSVGRWHNPNDETYKQERQKYASEVSGNDLDFVLTLNAENGSWSETTRSRTIGKNGAYDYGICQVNKGYHPKVVNDPNFKDWKWQVRKCYELYKGGTKFYGFNVRNKYRKLFIQN